MSTMMSNVKNTVMQAVTNKKFIIIVVLLALFIGLAFWVYTTYVAPKLNPEYKDNKEWQQYCRETNVFVPWFATPEENEIKEEQSKPEDE